MKRIVLDTNAYIRFLRGDKAVLGALSRAETVYMSVIVMGELYARFQGGSKVQQNKAVLEQFLRKSAVAVLEVDCETAQIFGEIKQTLKKSGTPIPINDVWLSAQTLGTGSVLVSCDRHFLLVPGLRVWDDIR